ncbi:MAG: sulfite exporter TauE/SafE family protein [Clostridia bacterium]
MSVLVGFLNGLLAAGAGHLLVFYLIYIKKIESHKARITSMSLMGIASIVTVFVYLTQIKVDYILVAGISVISVIMGYVGVVFMNKIESERLNLISAVTVFIVCIYKLFKV